MATHCIKMWLRKSSILGIALALSAPAAGTPAAATLISAAPAAATPISAAPAAATPISAAPAAATLATAAPAAATLITAALITAAPITAAPAAATLTTAAPAAAKALATSAKAAPTASYACRADTKFGKQTFSLRQGVDAKAPATVRRGTRFTIAVDLKPGSLPGEVKGFKLKEVRDLSLRIPVPANTSFVSATLSGGSGLNSTPTLERSGGVVTIHVGGPVPGGSAYQLPSLSVRLKAGARGRVIETKLQGTSFDNPGLNLQATIKWKFITIKSPVACYPDPNPALTRTQIR